MAYQLPISASGFLGKGSRQDFGSISDCWRNSLVSIRLDNISGSKIFSFITRVGVDNSPLDSDGFREMRCRNFSGAKTLSQQWKRLVLDKRADVTSKALTATVKPLFQVMTNYGVAAIDLEDLPDADGINGVHLAVVLRATFSYRDRTRGWDSALCKARKALSRDGIDEKDALVGLIY